jgi:hypothetical protein
MNDNIVKITISRYSDHKYFVDSENEFSFKIWTKTEILNFLTERLRDETWENPLDKEHSE